MILFSIIYTEETFQDIKQITDWYREQKTGLDDEFLLSFEAAIKRVQRNPLGYPSISKNARQILLQRFPHKIIFKVYDGTIKIYGVFHNSRNPQLIRRRLR